MTVHLWVQIWRFRQVVEAVGSDEAGHSGPGRGALQEPALRQDYALARGHRQGRRQGRTR